MSSFFDLPKTTLVKRVIAKNNFDSYTNTAVKKMFTDYILRITWNNKLSKETLNLPHKAISEIHVFKVELKEKGNVKSILSTIEKAIPYHIIFWIEYENEACISTSSKHANPNNEDISVVDWTFNSEWFRREECPYKLHLRESLDYVFKDMCFQLAGKIEEIKNPLEWLIEKQGSQRSLENQIDRLKNKIKNSKQFNEKVELNLELQKLNKKLIDIK